MIGATKELTLLLAGHQLPLSLMVLSMHSVAAALFRYSTALTPWTDAELELLFKIWMQVEKAAWKLTQLSICPFSAARGPWGRSARAPARSPHPSALDSYSAAHGRSG